ncbi:hypothetical protein C8R45DRAFT_922899 [Mycena sanguinolenta]|nr:hypothetical protein C8R45DRAFT_922899 [Mycena sanguinolenta]
MWFGLVSRRQTASQAATRVGLGMRGRNEGEQRKGLVWAFALREAAGEPRQDAAAAEPAHTEVFRAVPGVCQHRTNIGTNETSLSAIMIGEKKKTGQARGREVILAAVYNFKTLSVNTRISTGKKQKSASQYEEMIVRCLRKGVAHSVSMSDIEVPVLVSANRGGPAAHAVGGTLVRAYAHVVDEHRRAACAARRMRRPSWTLSNDAVRVNSMRRVCRRRAWTVPPPHARCRTQWRKTSTSTVVDDTQPHVRAHGRHHTHSVACTYFKNHTDTQCGVLGVESHMNIRGLGQEETISVSRKLCSIYNSVSHSWLPKYLPSSDSYECKGTFLYAALHPK